MITGRPDIPKKDLAAALTDLRQGVGTRFDPDVVQAFFNMVQTEKDILETGESVDHCLDILTQNMTRLAGQNRIEKKLANPFSSFF